ncbi:fatty acyl-CoA reductase wat-like [Arctopsyche grandis]|uniref:fatty acyl-CoA reductase wat-like n=1 Tax=Arctopsyche grandis TaxID=121162 RepID=UPI00406D83B8
MRISSYIGDELQDRETEVQKFYSGKCIFITGATGFFGKVLIEKLLKSCPTINMIYILLREKKGMCVEDRIKELLDCPMFANISNDCKEKIKYIQGEIGLPRLGISEENRRLLIDQVNIIFHCAATVRFNEKLKSALKINVIGTSDVVSLSKEILNLNAFIHVSTAYSNCHEDAYIKEEFYEPGISFDDVKNLVQISDSSILDAVTPRLIKKWPNTYTFTKCLSEDIIKREAANLPVAIFRPSVVVSTSGRSSVPGFIDNVYGPTGLIIGVGIGVLRVWHLDGELPSNLIPADYCINGMIAAAWDLSKNKYTSPPIYNHVPEPKDNVTWEVIISLWTRSGLHFPTDNCFWWPGISLIKNKLLFFFWMIMLHFVPGLIVDASLKIIGKKPILLAGYQKANKFMDLLKFFVSKKWMFEQKQMKNLRSRMSLEDLQLFYTSMENFDWASYALCQIHGVRVYLLKEKPSDLIRSRKRVQRLKYVHYFTKIIILIFSLYLGIFVCEKFFQNKNVM